MQEMQSILSSRLNTENGKPSPNKYTKGIYI